MRKSTALANMEDASREILLQIISVKSGLDVPVGVPLPRRSVTFLASGGRPLMTGTGLYRADRFTFKMRAER